MGPERPGDGVHLIPEIARRPGWLWWAGGASAAAAAVLLIALTWNLSTLRRELEDLGTRVTALRTELGQRDEMLRLLADPQLLVVQLAGWEPSPTATGRLFWNPVTRTGVLLTRGLPPATSDRAYELWAIAGNEPIPAGVLVVDREGSAFLRFPSLPASKTFDKFAVTLEPAGGVPKPTGPMHLLGSL